MKRIVVLMLAVMFLVTAFSGSALAMVKVEPLPAGDGGDAYTSGFAPELPPEFEYEQEYHQRAVQFLAEKYQVATEDIEVAPGVVQELKYVGRSFWQTKYNFSAEGKSEFGCVYIDMDSDKIYLQDEVDSLFKQEQEKMRAEYERLREEAGNIEVELYQQMQEMPDGEKLLTSVIPVYQADEELSAQLKQLKQEYADVSALVDDKNAVIISNRKEDVPFDQERMGQYLDKFRELKKQGYQQGLENIVEFMEAKGIEHEAKVGYREPRVQAQLAKNEITALADKAFVQAIRREVIYTIMETGSAADSTAGGGVALEGQPEIDNRAATGGVVGEQGQPEVDKNAANGSNETATDTKQPEKGSGSLPFVAGGAVVLGALAFFVKKK